MRVVCAPMDVHTSAVTGSWMTMKNATIVIAETAMGAIETVRAKLGAGTVWSNLMKTVMMGIQTLAISALMSASH